MLRILLLTIILILSQSAILRGTEPTLNDQYLSAFLRMNDAAQLEKEGHLCAAYALYADCRQKIIAVRNVNNEWVEFNPCIQSLGKKLAELRRKIEEQLRTDDILEPWCARSNRSRCVRG